MNVGILASDCYFPKTYVSQSDLEKYDGISQGKYEKGLGQTNMAFHDVDEDINSMMMNAVQNLLVKNNISIKDIGRIEVGTETIIDKSKSTKTSLMGMFGDENTDILGVTNINACYGGTSALFNTLDWVQSPSWDGRYGIVVCGDSAVYDKGPARPTGGAGVVAFLIGPDAPIVFDNKLRSSHFEDVYDFYKPFASSEYPAVDGHLSNACYLRALDTCYRGFVKKYNEHSYDNYSAFGHKATSSNHFLFHQPYTKLVEKSFGRLMYNDMRLGYNFDGMSEFKSLTEEESYTHKDLIKTCSTLAKDKYKDQVFPFTFAGRQLGNSYTGSLYFGLLSLIADTNVKVGDTISMFSYGSGLSATMFRATVNGNLGTQRMKCDLHKRLNDRTKVSADDYTSVMDRRKEYYSKVDYTPPSSGHIASGLYRLKRVDKMGRRTYARGLCTLIKKLI